jgi:hypothetical protein
VTGLAVVAVGWVCLAVGLIITVAVWTLIPIGACTLAAGLLVDWEAARGKRS